MSDLRTISLAMTHVELGWPTPEEISHPTGAGARVFAELVRTKIGRALARFPDARDAVVGVLMADPGSATSEPPLAVVVQFQSDANEETLRTLQRLVWNFSHSPTAITLEPELLRVWSCCEPPDSNRPLTGRNGYVVHELGQPDLLDVGVPILQRRAALAVHWINLVSGTFFRSHAKRFDRDGRADHMLLSNLRHIRDKLKKAGLANDDVCHDLLARIVFVQFLFDRKDPDGNAALTAVKLRQLQSDGTLHGNHANLASILGNRHDTYRLFDWLNGRFNGDLFPGKGDTPAARAAGWAHEKRLVTTEHLALLAEFIRGDLDMPTGQRCLWPQYSFDVIPLEFISSIYETFVGDRAAAEGIFYTPPHLVDFVLDRVLPWDSKDWDLTILDPACGSGIFLVKAFQRLVHRWKLANPHQTLRADTLRRLLERNLFGVDKDPHAVRVACFSLYLAMCDEIEPRYYWTQVVFPAMRNRRLINSDFFAEDHVGFRTATDDARYDLVVGNAPWGERVLTSAATHWANDAAHPWPIANKGIGTLFLPKTACLIKATGTVALIQSASSLLFNRGKKAVEFRRQFFDTVRVREIINLSALRFKVFKRNSSTVKQSVAPACIVVFEPGPSLPEEQIIYVCPKRIEQHDNEFKIVIEPQDRRRLTAEEAANPSVWTILMWGRNRDRAFLKRLQTWPSLAAPGPGYKISYRQGVNFGDRSTLRRAQPGWRLLDEKSFPAGSFLHLELDSLDKITEMRTHSRDSTDFTAFAPPQLIIKQSWQKTAARFQARLARSRRGESVLCNQSYITVHVAKAQVVLLEAACLSFNSMLASYFLLLNSGPVASYRPKADVPDLLAVPVPQPRSGLLDGLASEADVDARMYDAFGFKDAERVLIEDVFNYTLPDFQGNQGSPGRRPTARTCDGIQEPQLVAYCEYFIRVLKAGFGRDKAVTATIFHDPNAPMPFRLVAFELGRVAEKQILIEQVEAPNLLEEFKRLDSGWRKAKPSSSGIYQERLARVYESRGDAPTVFILKPDFTRYWTRSAGLNDADEVALDLFRWRHAVSRREAASG